MKEKKLHKLSTFVFSAILVASQINFRAQAQEVLEHFSLYPIFLIHEGFFNRLLALSDLLKSDHTTASRFRALFCPLG
jgi:hypothetical protein